MYNITTVYITTVYNLYCYMFRHFYIIIRECLYLCLAKLHKFSKLHLLILCFIYFYSKTNQMHNISNLFYFGTTLYVFRAVSPSIIRSLTLYIQHQVYVIQVLWQRDRDGTQFRSH